MSRARGCHAMISVVSPFYNEEGILEASVNLTLRNLTALRHACEMIVVNDGSTNGSPPMSRRAIPQFDLCPAFLLKALRRLQRRGDVKRHLRGFLMVLGFV